MPDIVELVPGEMRTVTCYAEIPNTQPDEIWVLPGESKTITFTGVLPKNIPAPYPNAQRNNNEMYNNPYVFNSNNAATLPANSPMAEGGRRKARKTRKARKAHRKH